MVTGKGGSAGGGIGGGAVKTSPPYRSGPSARCAVADECWEMVARSGTRCTLIRDTFGLGGDMMASLRIFFFFFFCSISGCAEDTLEFTLTKRTSVQILTYFRPKANSP